MLSGLERGFAGNHLQPHPLAPVGGVGAACDRSLGDRRRGNHRERCHSETSCGLDDKRGYTAAQ
jgi:hypothetical protein